jgi:hypothetical protein
MWYAGNIVLLRPKCGKRKRIQIIITIVTGWPKFRKHQNLGITDISEAVTTKKCHAKKHICSNSHAHNS